MLLDEIWTVDSGTRSFGNASEPGRLLTGCLMKIFMIISSGIFSDIFCLGFGLLGISIATVLCRVESSILGEEEASVYC